MHIPNEDSIDNISITDLLHSSKNSKCLLPSLNFFGVNFFFNEFFLGHSFLTYDLSCQYVV
jgi:hypothetical protein